MYRQYSGRCSPRWWFGSKVVVFLAGVVLVLLLGLRGVEATDTALRTSETLQSLPLTPLSHSDVGRFVRLDRLIPEDDESASLVTVDAVAVKSFTEPVAVNKQVAASVVPVTVSSPTTAHEERAGEQKVTSVVGASARQLQTNQVLSPVARLVLQGMNTERRAAGLPPLIITQSLVDSATSYASSLAEHGTLTHSISHDCGVSCRFAEYDLPLHRWGENLGWWQSDAFVDHTELSAGLLRGWMASEGHRANLLSTEFTATGVGVVTVGSEWFVVVHFGAF